MSRKNDDFEFHYFKKAVDSYNGNRVIQGRIHEWGDWSFELKLPGFTSKEVDSLVYSTISSLEALKPSLSTMLQEQPEKYIWEKALKKAVRKQLNARRVFVHQRTLKAYELRYARRTDSKPLDANLETINRAIEAGMTLSFVYPGENANDLPSTRFVKPLALELNASGQPYLRARRGSINGNVERSYLVARGESYVVHSTLEPLASWHVKFRRGGGTNTITAEVLPVR